MVIALVSRGKEQEWVHVSEVKRLRPKMGKISRSKVALPRYLGLVDQEHTRL